MTRRRLTNKKPTGFNRSLGNCLSNEREKARKKQKKREQGYEAENVTELDKNAFQNINSVTDETGLEEFLAKAELAGTNFAAEQGEFRILDTENSKTIVNVINTSQSLDDLYKKCGNRLRIPRRPPNHLWETVDDLTRLENEHFLNWRKNLAELQESDGVLLTPFERNLELWKQLWRVIELSDIVVQILDARNPLLFRNLDLEAYVKECGSTKQNVYLINKVDLLSREQIEYWRKWFLEANVDAVFWSALGPGTSDDSEMKGLDVAELDKKLLSIDENKKNAGEIGRKSEDHSHSAIVNDKDEDANTAEKKVPIVYSAKDLITFFKSRFRAYFGGTGKQSVVVGMVGYPNVGKSSTINKMMNKKKVAVSATPGKTRHFQTLKVDDELTLCDCPGLVMPSFALSRTEMVLNGILSIDHMREYISAIAQLLTRIPWRYFEKVYSVMLTGITNDNGKDKPLSAHNLLTTIAFMRGYMSSSGVPDCSRAARLILKDVVNGKLKWVAAPPNVDQKEFDKLTYGVVDEVDSSKAKRHGEIVQQLEKRHLLQGMKISDKLLDMQFFNGSHNQAHVHSMRSRPVWQMVAEGDARPSKKHFNKSKREKLRRIYAD